jgi:hypothetical protein
MNSFDVELRRLVDEWRERGASLASIIADLRAEIESLEDLDETE